MLYIFKIAVFFPDEKTTSLCCWDSRSADRQRLLSLGLLSIFYQHCSYICCNLRLKMHWQVVRFTWCFLHWVTRHRGHVPKCPVNIHELLGACLCAVALMDCGLCFVIPHLCSRCMNIMMLINDIEHIQTFFIQTLLCCYGSKAKYKR